MTLSPGQRLGHYEILSPLGAGGMGEVYRARDRGLERDVAIKVLPEHLAEDSGALSRFEREAKAVASLSHPNILAIHDFGREGRIAFAVMELLDGETLRQKMQAGSLSVRKAVDYALQIAQGLGAAHDRGVHHRDLKPENLIVTKEGRLKILDFGLARQTSLHASDESHSPTEARLTEAGAFLGTVGYMSPEQVRGRSADQRSDIFAFGCVLYEMLSGRRAFQGETAAETMTAILKEDPPPPSDTNAPVPPALKRILGRCLEKNPDERFRSANDLGFALEAVSGSVASAAASAARPATSRNRLAFGVAAGLALAATSFLVGRLAQAATGPSTFLQAAHIRARNAPLRSLRSGWEHHRLQRCLGREARGGLRDASRLPRISSPRYRKRQAPFRLARGRDGALGPSEAD